jgi:hypothetical protein
MLKFKCDRCNTPHNSDRAGDYCNISLPDDRICPGVIRLDMTRSEILKWAKSDNGQWLERFLERGVAIAPPPTLGKKQ